MAGEVPGGSSLAAKLNTLFETIYPRERGTPYSNKEVAAAIRARGGSISDVYIWQLRTDRRANPTIEHLQALADFFGVDPAYFFDRGQAEEIERDLRAMKAMKNLKVRAMAARLGELPDHNLDAVGEILDRVVEALQVERRKTARDNDDGARR